jgi:S1-C subfamily serine protease
VACVAGAAVGPLADRAASQDGAGGAGTPELRRPEAAIADVAERIAPSVVAILVDSRLEASDMPPALRFMLDELPADHLIQDGASGFVIHEDGSIVTSRHAIEQATRIRVRTADGRVLAATLVGTDRATDLAVIQVAAQGLPALRFASMERHRVGDWVLAVGAPFGLDTTVTVGVLSAIGRSGLDVTEIEDYVQTDAAIHVGSSGGPLVDLDGDVVGVITSVVGETAGPGFAISAALASDVVRQLREDGRVHRTWIGASHQDLTAELAVAGGAGADARGALVNAVAEGGPGARVGMEPGDVVVAIDGAPVRCSRDLTRAILQSPMGARIELTVLRGARERRVVLTTAEEPAREGDPLRLRERGARRSAPGLELLPLTPELARELELTATRGAVVVEVTEGGPAYRAGLRPGDVIVEADRRPVARPGDVERALRDGRALVRAQRGDRAFYAAIGGD